MPKNWDASLSPDFRRIAPSFQALQGKVLDVPCGFGRHSFALQELGCALTCVDIDEAALRSIENKDKLFGTQRSKTLWTLACDLENDPWPFKLDEFAGALNVHYLNFELLEKLKFSLKTRGLLYLETIGSFGENYLQLPDAGTLRRELEKGFDFRFYRESSAGPSGCGKVTARILAQKK